MNFVLKILSTQKSVDSIFIVVINFSRWHTLFLTARLLMHHTWSSCSSKRLWDCMACRVPSF